MSDTMTDCHADNCEPAITTLTADILCGIEPEGSYRAAGYSASPTRSQAVTAHEKADAIEAPCSDDSVRTFPTWKEIKAGAACVWTATRRNCAA